MSEGAQVTTGADIPIAQDTDFVLNTKFLGGMKVNEVKIFPTLASGPPLYEIYPHGLPYVPAVMVFQGGFPGIGWQNSAGIPYASANADGTNVYVQAPQYGPSVYLIIFAEKVADA